MIKLMKKLLTRELIMYVIFGVLTTLVSVVSYWLLWDVWGIHYSVANVISWIAAVTFAFFTNKIFVFRSQGLKAFAFIREMALFYGARLVSLGIEEVGLFLMIDILDVEEMVAKLVLQVVVVVLNYVLSKLIVFRKGKENENEKDE